MGSPTEIKENPTRIKFDATINLGHILTFVGFMTAGMVAWSTLDKRVVVIEEFKVNQAQINLHQEALTESNKRDVNEGFNRVNDKLDRLIERSNK